jgi:hypothetical protein
MWGLIDEVKALEYRHIEITLIPINEIHDGYDKTVRCKEINIMKALGYVIDASKVPTLHAREGTLDLEDGMNFGLSNICIKDDPWHHTRDQLWCSKPYLPGQDRV